jgi:ABC-type amino acid transport substrate-binding protein
VTILLEPFVQLGDSKDKYEGFYIDLLELIRAQLNFTYDIYLIPDGKFGIKESTGNWNGMVEHLVIGAADIALGPLSITSDRKRDIDFTAPIFDLVGTSILIRPGRVKYSLFKFIQVKNKPSYPILIV